MARPVGRLRELADAADIVVIGATGQHQHPEAEFTGLADHLVAGTTTLLLVAHASDSHRHSYRGRFLERRLYGPQVGGRGMR